MQDGRCLSPCQDLILGPMLGGSAPYKARRDERWILETIKPPVGGRMGVLVVFRVSPYSPPYWLPHSVSAWTAETECNGRSVLVKGFLG